MNSGKQNNADSEKEIASRTVQVQSKRFYLDVKQNWRGKFLKIAEVGSDGRKSRIIMGLSQTPELKQHLVELHRFYKQMKADSAAGDSADNSKPLLKSATMSRDNRRYYLDLRQNQRGKFLRIAQIQAGLYEQMRSQIAVPAEGLEDLKDKVSDLIEECGTDDSDESQPKLPGPKSLRAGYKMFYFDAGANRRGMYLRLSEVRNNYRTAITVPQKSWEDMRNIIDDMLAATNSANENNTNDNNNTNNNNNTDSNEAK